MDLGGSKETVMRYYYALVHKEPDSAYGVQFPDIEGAFSAADENEDIVSNAAEALKLHGSDMELPPPSNYEAVVSRPDVARELAQGAVLIRVPYIESDATLVRANLSIERGLLNAIDQAAAARGLTRSGFLAALARREIERAA
jgi:predicted RNase H-like HicB family nuclease